MAGSNSNKKVYPQLSFKQKLYVAFIIPFLIGLTVFLVLVFKDQRLVKRSLMDGSAIALIIFIMLFVMMGISFRISWPLRVANCFFYAAAAWLFLFVLLILYNIYYVDLLDRIDLYYWKNVRWEEFERIYLFPMLILMGGAGLFAALAGVNGWIYLWRNKLWQQNQTEETSQPSSSARGSDNNLPGGAV
ncbi:MAG: hypothetical protein JXA52_00700 [Planctomycetes bacterium]|nr:hypothetical protein [Planctomycetota bacterium]